MDDPRPQRQLIGYLHNGFSFGVTGNDREIDILQQLLVPNPQVKTLLVYTEGPNAKKLSTLNYTQLKEMRKR